MKTIGLIGGMSWESTVPYYKIINEEISKSLGGLHSAKIVLYSVDFDELNECLNTENWDKISDILGEAAKKLQDFGSDFILICTNTMHKVAPIIQGRISVPIVHIALPVAITRLLILLLFLFGHRFLFGLGLL